MKMTPMQEMLEWVRATLPMDLDWPMLIEEKVKSLIPKEKEVMYRAYKSHRPITMMDGSNKEVVDGVHMKYKFEQYYNETFNTEKK
jgi:hypothetical protein